MGKSHDHTEDDFQAALDANCDDRHTRLVLADWLQDREDPRADGYRALGRNEMHPMCLSGLWGYLRGSLRLPGAQWMPYDWYEFCRRPGQIDEFVKTRREAEDAAAIAFFQLPVERRAELLSLEVVLR